MTMCVTARRACSPRSTPPTAPSSPRSTAGTGPSSSKSSSPRSTPKSPMDWRFIWSAITTAPTSPPASSSGWKRILGSTCTSPRRTRPGSTRSNDSSPTSPPTCSNAATTAAFRHSNPTFANGSQAGTRTRSHSSGPSPRNRSSNPSNDFYSELPAQDTSSSKPDARRGQAVGKLRVCRSNLQQAIVFGNPLAPSRGARLHVAGARPHRQVRDERVWGLARPVRDELRIARLPADPLGLESLGDGPDLVDLDQRGVADLAGDRLRDDGRIGDKDVVTHELQTVAQPGGQALPTVPIDLRQAVLDQPHREVGGDLFVAGNHVVGGERLAGDVVVAVAVELAGRGVQRNRHAGLTGRIPGVDNRLDDQRQHVLRLRDVGGEAALVAEPGRLAPGLQQCPQPRVDGRTGP